MLSFITKVWIFLLLLAVLTLAFGLVMFVLIGAGIIALITIPYIMYIKWKAKKQLENSEVIKTRIVKIEKVED